MTAALVAPRCLDVAHADEAGSSFWLPGSYASFAAVASNPGWSFDSTTYHATAAASANVSFARGGGIQAGLKTASDYLMLTPTYSFATPVLGGQAALGMTALVGRYVASSSATLTGPGGASLSGSHSDYIVGHGDLYPTGSLKWNSGVHNVMIYGTAGIPAGLYDPTRLATLGLGYWVVDGGAGYTYYDEQAKIEWSVVAGLTYNFINPYTQYQSGIDSHVDWAFSPYVGDNVYFGAVGYIYNQVTGDSGPGARLGEFKSRVVGIGPQVGFFFPVGDRKATLSLRGYREFDAKNRPEGWTAYMSFTLEAPDQKTAKTLRR